MSERCRADAGRSRSDAFPLTPCDAVAREVNTKRAERLQPQDPLAVVEIRQQGRSGAVMEDGAALQNEDAVGKGQNQIKIVLDDDDRDVLPQPVEDAEQLLHDRRRQPFEWLVQEQQVDVS